MKKFAFTVFFLLLLSSQAICEDKNYFFYKPQNAWPADFIPFFDNGKFRLFYLLDWRDKEKHGEGTPWYQISTDNLVNFTEHGEMLPRGTKDEQDLYVFTGSVIKAGGMYHIFYTGHNPYFTENGKHVQGIMHAVSSDLLKWQKVPEDTFFADPSLYEKDDWRDPFVFRNDETGEYWMLVAARLKDGPSRHRGCTALCKSKDLKTWVISDKPFWSPGLYFTHECPDLFKMGDWWYLVYSTFTERCVTHYRMSKSLNGPWTAPANDTFDGHAYYAAKTASDGKHRYAFGWNPTRDNEKDDTAWNWGGNLVIHELVQNPDGTLFVKLPENVEKAFSKEIAADFTPFQGKWDITANKVSSVAEDSFAGVSAIKLPERCLISTTVTFKKNTRGCGIMLRMDNNFENGYYIKLEPMNNRLVFDTWPRKAEIPFMVELERNCTILPDVPHTLKIIVDNTLFEAYLDNKIAMSGRIYDHKEGKLGLFVQEGEAKFENTKVYVLK